MAQQTINVGAAPNDGTGTPLRTAFQYTNSNFTELYTALGGGSGLPGASTQVIFNDGGTNLAGSAGLVFNKTTSVLGVGTVNAGAAIVSGDLTVDTSTLKVDSANNRVGIGTATPYATLHANSAIAAANFDWTTTFTAPTVGLLATSNNSSAWIRIATLDSNPTHDPYVNFLTSGGQNWSVGIDNSDSDKFKIALSNGFTGSNEIFAVDPSAVFSWYDGAGGTRMTLNSTGLGVGGSPDTGLFTVGSTGITSATTPSMRIVSNKATFVVTSDGATNAAGTTINYSWANGGQGPLTFRNASIANVMTLDSSGNVGIGVTPSAWGNNFKVVQVGQAGSVYGAAVFGYYGTKFNLYNNNTNDIAISTNFVGEYRFELLNGSHVWLNKSTAGSVGVAQTLTQAMTLAANGQLLLGTSTTDGAIDIGMVLNKPSATGFVGNSYQLNGSSKAFTYISSAAGAFRVDTVTGYTINMVSATNGVYLANGGTSWTALSDERFKDIIEPISNAVAKVGSIRSVIGKFKTESEGTRRSFLIAQDVQAVLPEAVDASNPEKLGVSYTEVIPLLVAAIKELTARVQTLEAK